MDTKFYLDWITVNPGTSLLLGVLFTIGLVTVTAALVNIVRALTGKYPPAEGCSCNDNDNDDDTAEISL